MTTQRERERYRAAKAAVAPAVHDPKEGQPALYYHPAGPVQGTVTAVTRTSVEITVQRANDLPDLVLKFTKRKDGAYRLVGEGPTARRLKFLEEGK